MVEPVSFLGGRVMLRAGDCREAIKAITDGSIDAVVTDPPYALVSIGKRFGKPGSAPAVHGKDGLYARASAGFMGKSWDTGEVAFDPEFWVEVLRVLKPGGHVVAFGGTRAYHRLACAIEDAGFEIRDQLAWAYGTGFPKNHDVSKAIDKAAGAERQRMPAQRRARDSSAIHSSGFGADGWSPQSDEPMTAEAAEAAGIGTALKPAWEPIVLARKPILETVAETFVQHGTGGLNIDRCRVGSDTRSRSTGSKISENLSMAGANYSCEVVGTVEERWPANILHDGGDEVAGCFGLYSREAVRFFYSAKADASDRIGSKHPTVKPVDLMQWLCRLITPPGGTVLDPFAGTGTTGEAAFREGFSAVLIEREADYRDDIARRMALAEAGPATRKAESAKARFGTLDAGPLFGGAEASGGGRTVYGQFANDKSGRSG